MLKEFIEDSFPGLASDEGLLQNIAEQSAVKYFQKGDIIIDYGEIIQFVPLVVKGLLKIMRENDKGEELLLYYLSEGNTCAASFSCCMIRKKSEIIAIAEEDSTVLAIPLLLAEKWMQENETWRNFVLTIYDERLFALIDTIDQLAFAKLDEKLWNYLEERGSYSDEQVINSSHFEIARDLNVSREAVSRLLKKLEKSGKVNLERNRIRLL